MADTSSSTSPSLPGTTGTFASRASDRARFLSPSRFMASGVGPMKSMLQLRQTSLKWAFSARNPYPGWIASTLPTSAALITWSIFR